MSPRKLAVLIGTIACCISYSNAQTAYAKFEDGKLIFRLKADQPAPEHGKEGALNIDDFDFLVELKKDFQLRSLSKPFIRVGTPEFERTLYLEFSNPYDVDLIERQLNSLPEIEFVEKLPVTISTAAPPNDRFYHPDSAWQLFQVDAQGAWNVQPVGNKNIIVAVADNAININHIDLKANVWNNTAEINGITGVDDDGNGYVDDKRGWDVPNNDGDPSPPDIFDQGWIHGMHVAGLAGAVTDNNLGMASLSRNVTVMCIKGASDHDKGYVFLNTVKMVEYAVVNKPHVLNMSWGAATYTKVMDDMIKLAAANDIFMTGGAGNFGDENKFYPAALDPVMAVGNSDDKDKKWTSSTYGTWVDIFAPAMACISLGNSKLAGGQTLDGYLIIGGTSMAAPQVASLAGLMLSYDPSLTATQIRNVIESTAVDMEPLNPGFTGKLGAGRVDAGAAMRELVATGVEDPEESLIKLYPNPGNGWINISNAAGAEIKIYDPAGKLVHTVTPVSNHWSMDLELSAGAYFLTVDGNRGAEKLIITR